MAMKPWMVAIEEPEPTDIYRMHIESPGSFDGETWQAMCGKRFAPTYMRGGFADVVRGENLNRLCPKCNAEYDARNPGNAVVK